MQTLMVNQVFSVGQKSDFNVQGAEKLHLQSQCNFWNFLVLKCMQEQHVSAFECI